MCDHQLWPDIVSVVCRREDPHLPGVACRYVVDPPAPAPVASQLQGQRWIGIAV